MTSPFRDRPVLIETARLRWQATGEPVSEQFGDLYFSASGGLSETRYVFIEHNHLPQRLERSVPGDTFTIAETGFGTGLNFLATAELWRQSSAGGWLHFVSFERYPLAHGDLKRALARWPELVEYAEMLLAQYPPAIGGVHRLVWPRYRIRLTLYFGDALAGLEALPFVAQAWYLDGFNPRINTGLWNEALYRAIAGHSAAGTTFATYSAAGAVRRGLAAAGFRPEKVTGHKPKRDMLRGHFEPEAPDRASAAGEPRASRRIIVVGAGLAGCLIASNLAGRGREVTLVEAGPGPGTGASGNGQGALYVKLGVDYNLQCQLSLAALLYAQRHYTSTQEQLLQELSPEKALRRFWHPTGLLQLATTEEEADRQSRFAERHQYPESVLTIVSPEEASHLAGMAISHRGLYFPASGWLSPSELCQALSARPGVTLMPQTTVRTFGEGPDGHWVDVVSTSDDRSAYSQRLSCDQLVLCPGASDMLANLNIPARQIRGQISWWPADTLPSPACVVCGDGYINPSDGERLTLGATFDLRDPDPAVRPEDHRRNLEAVGRWLPAIGEAPGEKASQAGGRTAFRCTTPDYQPLAGFLYPEDALPATVRELAEPERARTGIAVLAGLGSKGLAYAPLLAEWLCDRICGEAPVLPLELAAIVHPQRFTVRQRMRASAKERL